MVDTDTALTDAVRVQLRAKPYQTAAQLAAALLKPVPKVTASLQQLERARLARWVSMPGGVAGGWCLAGQAEPPAVRTAWARRVIELVRERQRVTCMDLLEAGVPAPSPRLQDLVASGALVVVEEGPPRAYGEGAPPAPPAPPARGGRRGG